MCYFYKNYVLLLLVSSEVRFAVFLWDMLKLEYIICSVNNTQGLGAYRYLVKSQRPSGSQCTRVMAISSITDYTSYYFYFTQITGVIIIIMTGVHTHTLTYKGHSH